MVTHDPVVAAHADRAVFLADGQVVDVLAAPTADTILEAMKSFERVGTRPLAEGTPCRRPRRTHRRCTRVGTRSA
jgi:hypothetical protein